VVANILSCKLDTNKDHQIQVLLKLEYIGLDKKRDIGIATIESTPTSSKLLDNNELVTNKVIYLNKIAELLEKYYRRALSNKARFYN